RPPREPGTHASFASQDGQRVYMGDSVVADPRKDLPSGKIDFRHVAQVLKRPARLTRPVRIRTEIQTWTKLIFDGVILSSLVSGCFLIIARASKRHAAMV